GGAAPASADIQIQVHGRGQHEEADKRSAGGGTNVKAVFKDFGRPHEVAVPLELRVFSIKKSHDASRYPLSLTPASQPARRACSGRKPTVLPHSDFANASGTHASVPGRAYWSSPSWCPGRRCAESSAKSRTTARAHRKRLRRLRAA